MIGRKAKQKHEIYVTKFPKHSRSNDPRFETSISDIINSLISRKWHCIHSCVRARARASKGRSVPPLDNESPLLINVFPEDRVTSTVKKAFPIQLSSRLRQLGKPRGMNAKGSGKVVLVKARLKHRTQSRNEPGRNSPIEVGIFARTLVHSGESLLRKEP